MSFPIFCHVISFVPDFYWTIRAANETIYILKTFDMKTFAERHHLVCLVIVCLFLGLFASPARADQPVPPEFRAQFLKLCDAASAKLIAGTAPGKGPFFVDSYAIRALCAAYDMTGNTNYLRACRIWSDRMVKFQDKMIPPGAYYMNYNRKPGQSGTNEWFAADSSSIGMAILATAIRSPGAERQHLLDSTKKFADLVIQNFVRPSGGVSDGLWAKSHNEWWCSSALFGSFVFNLYANTGDERYLKAALGVTDWLNHWDLTKDQPFPLSQQGPAMIMYVMENYSAGWPYISRDSEREKAAQAKVAWCFDWIAKQQQIPVEQRHWSATVWWGTKFGGLPFHEYIFAAHPPGNGALTAAGDHELQDLAPLVFTAKKPQMTQLSMFMMMSYAERLNPGAVYRSQP